MEKYVSSFCHEEQVTLAPLRINKENWNESSTLGPEFDVGSYGSVSTSHPGSPNVSYVGPSVSLAPGLPCPRSSSSMGSLVRVVMTSS